jgi:hypothetical protein
VRHEEDGDNDPHEGEQKWRNLGAKTICISHDAANVRRQSCPVKLVAKEKLRSDRSGRCAGAGVFAKCGFRKA